MDFEVMEGQGRIFRPFVQRWRIKNTTGQILGILYDKKLVAQLRKII